MQVEESRRTAGALVLALAVAVTALLYLLNLGQVFDPPLLLPVLNGVLITLASLVVAFLAARSYLLSGMPSLLLTGAGVLLLGLTGLISGSIAVGPNGTNVGVTIYNLGALLSGGLHLVAAVLRTLGISSWENGPSPRAKLATSQVVVVALVVALTVAAMQGWTPLFFIQGRGSTLARDFVLGSAVLLYWMAAGLFFTTYVRSQSLFIYWYSIGLAFIGLGLFTSFLVHALGTPLNWAGRIEQYIGCFYFLLAIRVLFRSARQRGVPLELALADFFRQAETNYRDLVESSPNAIVATDQGGRILFWNTSAEQLFGFAQAPSIGMRVAELLVGNPAEDALSAALRQAVHSGENHYAAGLRETDLELKDGRRVPVEFSLAARKGPAGWAATYIIRDISERRRAESALEELLAREKAARAEAEAATRVRDQFISLASHELKTPLTSIKGYAELLDTPGESAGLTEKQRRGLRVVHQQTIRLEKMITALLDISRIERGQLAIERAPVDMQALTRVIVTDLRPTLRRHRIDLIERPGEMVVEGDEIRLEQVIQNLIQNAIKYSPEGGEVTVTLARMNGNVVVSVSDQGIGIPQEELPRLFTRFYRATNAEACHINGLGIGLFVTREIVRRHGGKISVESREGVGSTFTVTLPVTTANQITGGSS